MAYTLTQLQDLERAIATAASSIRKADGSSMEMRSLNEMLQLKAVMERELGLSSTGIRTETVVCTKGL